MMLGTQLFDDFLEGGDHLVAVDARLGEAQLQLECFGGAL
jgi:hypothetical protein